LEGKAPKYYFKITRYEIDHQSESHAMRSLAIGVHVHAESERLRETLAAIETHTSGDFDLLLLPDGPDSVTHAALASLADIRQSPSGAPLGPAACFNRLARQNDADMLILIESGTLVSPSWLDKLLAALDADPRHGLACPSTNHAWNELAAFPLAQSDAASLAFVAAEADRRFGTGWKSLAPLWGVGDYCLAADDRFVLPQNEIRWQRSAPRHSPAPSAPGGMQPKRMRQAPQQLVALVVVDDRLAEHRAEARHPVGQPFRDVTAVQWQIGASGSVSHQPDRSRVRGSGRDRVVLIRRNMATLSSW
jgi:hypothetical protein